MQKKALLSSSQFQHGNQSRQGKQILKFELPLNRMNQRKDMETKNVQLSVDKQNQAKLEKIIIGKLSQVQSENKKLLEIASKINNSSLIFSNDDKLHQIVYGIEQQMKYAFNDLIESIQEFYIDIDTKIKQIGSYLAGLSGTQTLQTSSNYGEDFIFGINQQQKPSGSINQQQTFRLINHRIEMLQKDLNETKSNEIKLMTIIDKLVSKYQLTHETTMVKEDPFLTKKIQNMMGLLQVNQKKGSPNSDNRTQQYSGENSGRFMEANTFAKTNNYASNQGLQHGNFNRNNLVTSNVRKQQNPQRFVQQQNPNDYSIYQELNKIQQYNQDKQSHTQKQKHFNSNVNQPTFKKKVPENLGASTVSVQSYAYSNSMQQNEQEQCFIRKLYSKQPPTLNKVSLKSCNQNNTFFQFNKPKEQLIDQSNKNHRQAFLLTQLKR